MSELTMLCHEYFGTIRTMQESGNVIFCGADVASALGYANAPDALTRHCRAIVKRDTPISGKIQKINFISEGDVYRLIAHSKLPAAEKFERWVFDEILPTIRRTGGYVSNEDMFVDTYLPQADEGTKAIFKQTLSAMRDLNRKIEEDKPKVALANAVTASSSTISVAEMAKLLRQNGIETGATRFYAWLRNHGYLIAASGGWNLPTQRSMEMGLFEIREGSYEKDSGEIILTRTARVTGKGQEYFIKKFLRSAS